MAPQCPHELDTGGPRGQTMSTGTYGLPTLAPRLDVVYGGVSCPSTIVILKLGNYFSNADQRAFCTWSNRSLASLKKQKSAPRNPCMPGCGYCGNSPAKRDVPPADQTRPDMHLSSPDSTRTLHVFERQTQTPRETEKGLFLFVIMRLQALGEPTTQGRATRKVVERAAKVLEISMSKSMSTPTLSTPRP